MEGAAGIFELVTHPAQPMNTLGGGIHLRQRDRAVIAGIVEGDCHLIVVDKYRVDENINNPPLAVGLVKIQLPELQ